MVVSISRKYLNRCSNRLIIRRHTFQIGFTHCGWIVLALTNFASRQVRAAVPGPLAGASKQVRSYAAEAKASPTEVSSILEQRIRGVHEEAGLAETGRVLSVGYVLD
jgi:hypothetical protein